MKSIILPVPSATTKGVVLCRTAYGNLLVGPTAEEQESRCDSGTDRETLALLRDKGIAMLPALAGIPVPAAYAATRPAREPKESRLTTYPARSSVTVGGLRTLAPSSTLRLARGGEALLEGGRTPPAPHHH